MEFFDVIKKRQSITKYKGDEICKGSLDNMINSAMRSPSWKNRTSFKIIIIDDSKIKEKISEYVLNKDNKAEEALIEAPMAVVVISQPEKSGEIEGKEFYIADGAIAMEHFILAATAEGYGTMWIGALEEDKVKSLLGIPNDYRIIGISPVGVAAEVKEHNVQKNIRDYVFKNKFNDPYTMN
ncbi:nitroreductase family protein [Clostridium sardiniense]